jgi:hypothetical protein
MRFQALHGQALQEASSELFGHSSPAGIAGRPEAGDSPFSALHLLPLAGYIDGLHLTEKHGCCGDTACHTLWADMSMQGRMPKVEQTDVNR